MNILVTGGAGYIGSHAVLRLVEAGHFVQVVDNLDRGNRGAVETLRSIGGDRVGFTEMDVRDGARLLETMRRERIDSVMHFAALAYVGESVDEPLRYYDNNAVGSLSVINAALEAGVARFIFSSTCASYGEPGEEHLPIDETCPQDPVNPYGRSKLVTEWMLRDAAAAAELRGQPFAFAALRYFNVAGADKQTRLGEDHRPESHLIPICLEVALGKREALTIYGSYYPTPDGTCIRDYIHVDDLADAHVKALAYLGGGGDTTAVNVGTGVGSSVLDVLNATADVAGKPVPYDVAPRRAGDPVSTYSDPTFAQTALGWRAQYGLKEIINSAYTWHRSQMESDARSTPQDRPHPVWPTDAAR